jgi:hypothetical protein
MLPVPAPTSNGSATAIGGVTDKPAQEQQAADRVPPDLGHL